MGQDRIDPETVAKVAKLAKLRFSNDELEQFSGQLGQIVDYVDQLSDVDTSQVAPLDHVLNVTDAIREDTQLESLPPESALKNAPEQDGEYFRVPPVLG